MLYEEVIAGKIFVKGHSIGRLNMIYYEYMFLFIRSVKLKRRGVY